MPFEITTFNLPSGARCVRLVGSGHIGKEDADYLLEHTGPGRPLYHLPLLALTQELTGVSSEARALFADDREEKDQVWLGVVVTSPLIRVTTNFLVRISRNKKVRMFSDEAEAIQWLDERAREDAAKAKAAPNAL